MDGGGDRWSQGSLHCGAAHSGLSSCGPENFTGNVDIIQGTNTRLALEQIERISPLFTLQRPEVLLKHPQTNYYCCCCCCSYYYCYCTMHVTGGNMCEEASACVCTCVSCVCERVLCALSCFVFFYIIHKTVIEGGWRGVQRVSQVCFDSYEGLLFTCFCCFLLPIKSLNSVGSVTEETLSRRKSVEQL